MRRIYRGARGRNGSTSDASAMDSMFPKLERVAMRHVLHDVRVGAPPLSDSVGKQSEVWRKQDDVGRLAGNIRAAVDGKPNIGGMDGGRVVDAVRI